MAKITVPPKVLPVTPENYPAEIPTFSSEAEERDFWDTHDTEFYFADGVDASLEPPPPDFRPATSRKPPPLPSRWTGEDFGQVVTIRFTTPEFERVSARARSEGVSVEDLVRRWIMDPLDSASDSTGHRETA